MEQAQRGLDQRCDSRHDYAGAYTVGPSAHEQVSCSSIFQWHYDNAGQLDRVSTDSSFSI